MMREYSTKAGDIEFEVGLTTDGLYISFGTPFNVTETPYEEVTVQEAKEIVKALEWAIDEKENGKDAKVRL